MTKQRLGYLALIMTVVIWGSTFIVIRNTVQTIGPFTLSVLRFVISLAVLAPFAYRQGYRLRQTLQPTFLGFGLTGVTLYYGLQNLGLMFIPAGITALLLSPIPAVTAILAVIFLKEKLTHHQLLGIGLAVLGTLLVGSSGVKWDGNPTSIIGVICILGGVLAWAVYTIQGKKLTDQYPPIVLTTASISSGLFLLLPWAFGELWLKGPPTFDYPLILAIVYLGSVASALAMFLWNYALRYVPASTASLFLNLIPIVGLIGALIGGETIGLLQLGGGALALLGVWLSSRT